MEIVLPEFRVLDATSSSDSNSLSSTKKLEIYETKSQISSSSTKKLEIYETKPQISSLRNNDHNRIKSISSNIYPGNSYENHVNGNLLEPRMIKNRTRNSIRNSTNSCSSQRTLVNLDPELSEDDNSIMESGDEQTSGDKKTSRNAQTSADKKPSSNVQISDEYKKNKSTSYSNVRNDRGSLLRNPNTDLGVFLMILLVSLASYILGSLGSIYIWMFMLYHCVKWYINTIKCDNESIEWEIKRQISMDKLKRNEGETVEWLNYLLLQIWRTLDPSLLVGLRDMLEDAMSRSAPSFVRATDIEAFEIGLIAPRIDHIKVFPPSESEGYEDVLIGEARFSFRARSKTLQDPPPPHILAWIKTGISALIPIRVEILALVASVHFEIKLTGTSPFVSTARISFLNVPLYETSIMPLIPMNIAQQFISTAVRSVFEDLTYPKFKDINLGELLSASTDNDIQAIGIMKVGIFEARNLTKVDVHGENDPYVISSLDPTPYMNTHNTTRIIENCANPKWNETFFHKIPQLDIVDEHIKFKLGVMDWDRFTPDDPIGNVWIDIKNVIGDGTKGVKISDGWQNLYLKPTDSSSSRGQLRFRLEYFPKLPKNIEPSHDQTSGILGLQIHQAMGLQITAAPYAKEAGVVLSDNVYNAVYPNPYCVVYLNDIRAFRTRAKLNNTAPYWNASTEQFVKDWRTAVVRIVVKDQKDLEYDPVIGMATIPLKGLIEHKGKQGAKWYPLRHGVGCGKVRLSFVFRSIAINLTPEEKGYDVGTLLVHSIVAEDLDSKLACNNMSLTLSLCGSSENEQCTILSHGNPPSWLVTSNCADNQNKLQFGVLRRHRTGLIITLKQRGIFGMTYNVGTANFWLKDIQDCKEIEVKLPIYAKNSENSSILQNQEVQEPIGNLANEISYSKNGNVEDNQSNAGEGSSKIISFNESHEYISNEPQSKKIIYDEPQQLNTSEESSNITPNELSQQESCHGFSSLSNDTKKQVRGYLKVKLYFRPGLSTAHEEDIRKSLTGVNANILELNPFQNVQIRRDDDETDMFDIEERNIPDDTEMYEGEIGSGRRINRVHRRKSMRQLQWVKDLVRAQVTKKMTGKKDWEEQEIIEHEV
ncbi:20082_t:CDS:10 [Gigaspora margarita]|uniref:20082_t:CDS:1 n=1 Tax=Gigaspora margarita TaxID=4874 RepID=A0ABM8VYD1_GIGMA|nr:20082_t:CDS:10 [Gigaspora margarita]